MFAFKCRMCGRLQNYSIEELTGILYRDKLEAVMKHPTEENLLQYLSWTHRTYLVIKCPNAYPMDTHLGIADLVGVYLVGVGHDGIDNSRREVI